MPTLADLTAAALQQASGLTPVWKYSLQDHAMAVLQNGSKTAASVVVATGIADSAAILTAFNSMKVSGHATGTLIIRGTAVIDTPLVLDGGYSNTQGSLSGGGTPRFTLVTDGALVAASGIGAAITLSGFYNVTADLKFQGGGGSRSVSDLGINATSASVASATGFTSADVGRYIRVEGAGDLGHAPYIARITVQAGGTATTDGTAATSVVNAQAYIQDIALHVVNCSNPDIGVEGVGFAGVLLHMDSLGSSANDVTQAQFRYVRARSCGQAISMKNMSNGFGGFTEVWDTNCVQGSIFERGSDCVFVHYENYSPSTQTVGVLFNNCNQISGQTFNLGNAATEAVMKVVAGDVGHFDRLYITSSSAARDGLELVEVKSIDINSVNTDHCTAGVHILGGGQDGIVIRNHFSLTSDTNPLVIAVGPSTSAPQIDMGVFYEFCTGYPVTMGALTGGTVKLHGQFKNDVYSGVGGADVLISSTSAGVLDYSGLTNDKTYLVSQLTNHPGVRRATSFNTSPRKFTSHYHGYSAWSFDPNELQVTATVSAGVTTGKALIAAVPVTEGFLLSNIDVYLYGAGSALTNSFIGVFDKTFTKIAVSADCSAKFSTGGQQSIAVVTPIIIPGGPDEVIYIWLLANWATTTPTFLAKTSYPNPTVANMNLIGSANLPFRMAADGTVRSAIPTNFLVQGGGANAQPTNVIPWVGLS